MAPLILDMFTLPRALTDEREADRLAALKQLARPLQPQFRVELTPISAKDDLLLQLEFFGWIAVLAANPLTGAICAAAGAMLGRPRLAVFGAASLFACFERLTRERMPAGPPTANAERFARYLSLRLLLDGAPEAYSSKCIFAMVPHGIFPASLFGFLLMHARLPFNRIVCAQASATFYFPYWRQFSRWMGNVQAGRREMTKALEKGHSVTTFMDGIHGMFTGESQDVERLWVKEKKGLARIALLTGTPLVPCYCFGQTRLVRTVADPFGLMLGLSRFLRVSLVLPLGRNFLPIPVRTPCTIALGQPIPVKRLAADDESFAAEVERLHAALLAETVALFERHKAQCGFDGAEAVVE